MKKININTENIISALFILGFTQIDAYLLTAITAQLTIEARKNKTNHIILDNEHYNCTLNLIKDDKPNKTFLKFVDYQFIIKLKEGATLDTDIYKAINLNSINCTFRQYISSQNNKLLAEYIQKNIDLNKIIIEKISIYGKDNIDCFKQLFCDKEKSMIMDMFGINDMFRKVIDQSIAVNNMLYNQENNDIDSAINTLKKIKNN